MPPLLMKLVFDRIESAPMPFFVRPIANGDRRQGDEHASSNRSSRRISTYMEAELARSDVVRGRASSPRPTSR